MEAKIDDGFYEKIKSRVLLERLLLKRNPLDYQAYVETFRESLIDANPHQVEAIVFALEKLENGGCILADEVGLGKTIEAGLVLSQYRAQHRDNVLIIVPTSLAGQWSSELRRLFQISSRIITAKDKKGIKKEALGRLFEKNGIYILGREFASRLEKEKVLSQKNWDLIIVDEAHEVFANIYRRFNPRNGQYNPKSKESSTAAHMFTLLKRSPILLLTATPIQNNILELWGLSSYILPERDKSHLGQFNHFKELFLKAGDIIEEKIPELKERISNFLVRNLRVNAQDFMKYKFTKRDCQTLNFYMDEDEKQLYNAISNYFERDDIYAYATNGLIDLKNDHKSGIRNLLKMSYRRVLGSSFAALTKSLHGIVKRLEKMRDGEWETVVSAITTDDWENDEEDREQMGVATEETEETDVVFPFIPTENDIQAIENEIVEVKTFIQQAEKLQATGKDKKLIDWLRDILNTPERFSGKAVIFTTYTATQHHLLNILEENGFLNDVLLFSGNPSRSDKEKKDLNHALSCWEEEIAPAIAPDERPTGAILERTALVYYFKTRKKIFISTEAGAKGLNLQFCNVIVNYDLPWNPQRIEQRIGRCHRYGQVRDVLVLNCINADNETEQRIYNILQNKFSLFKSLMGAGDDVLGTLSKAFNFEQKINEILNNFKTPQERLISLQLLEEQIDEEKKNLIHQKLKNTQSLMDDLDPLVKWKLKNIQEKLPESFGRYDSDMLELLRCIAHSHHIPFTEVKKEPEQIFLQFHHKNYYIGKRDEENIRDYQHLDLKHPTLQHWSQQILNNPIPENLPVDIRFSDAQAPSDIIKPYLGQHGRWDFYRVAFKGMEEEEHLYDVVCIHQNNHLTLLQQDEIDALKQIPHVLQPHPHPLHPFPPIDPQMQNWLKQKIVADSQRISEIQQPRINKQIHNLEVELKDNEEYLKKEELEIQAHLLEVDKKIGSTFDNEIGKKLLDQKRKLKDDLNRCRSALLEFQKGFYKSQNDREFEIEKKRFIDHSHERIFSFQFRIQ